MKKIALVPPFLFGLFPILSLYASNVLLVRPHEVFVPSVLVLTVSGVLVFVAYVLLRDIEGAAISVSAAWVLLVAYGRALAALGGPNGGREYALLAASLAVFSGVVFAVRKWRGKLQGVVQVVAIMSIALVAMPVAKTVPVLISRQPIPVFSPGDTALGKAELQAPSAHRRGPEREPALPAATPTEPEAKAPKLAAPAAPVQTPTPTATPSPAATSAPGQGQPKPDIYYIIVDGYARQDVLQELYGYDNTAFLQGLADRGFYVASQSRANYCQTYLSLASSLNGTHLDALAASVLADTDDRRTLQDMIRDNSVANFMREQGYTYVAYSTGYLDAELESADLCVTAPQSLSQFTSGLMNTAPISPVIALQYDLHRQRLLYAFDHLPDAARMDGPVFVFAHICAPHPPFVFTEDGESVTPNREFSLGDGTHYMSGPERAETAEYLEGYRRQLTYINKRIEQMVDAILAASPEPPIIILQSDHGPGSQLYWFNPQKTNMKERLSILNAYLVPENISAHLYEEITPVNTFRIIFNELFGTRYDLAPDASYFSTWDRPYRLIPVSP